MKPTMHIIRGPGFIEDSELNARLEGLGFTLSMSNIVPGKLFDFSEPVLPNDYILARGPWSVDPENYLYARLIASSLRGVKTKVLSATSEKNDCPKVVATGRGALAALMAGWAGEATVPKLYRGWQSFKDMPQGPWQKFDLVSDPSKKYFALVEGFTCPDLGAADAQEFLKLGDSKAWAWTFPNQLYSFVDPLAFFDGSQLDNFGYGSHEGLLKNIDFFEHCMEVL